MTRTMLLAFVLLLVASACASSQTIVERVEMEETVDGVVQVDPPRDAP